MGRFVPGVAALLAALLAGSAALAAEPEVRAAEEGARRGRPSVAVVLGGGSARGLSHIGLLKALYEEGIPVDYLVGTSMGSVIAGLHAAGLSVDELAHLAVHVALDELFEPQVPLRGGLINANRFERFLDAVVGGITMAETVIPYYSVATHLQTGKETVFGPGPVKVSRAILASMAIPGLFAPVEIDGEYYVDGGIASIVPVRAARELGADVVIAVDVRRSLEPVNPHNVISVLDLVLDHLLDANVESQISLADVVVHPQLRSDSYMDYDQVQAFIAEGYRAAREAMPAIKEALVAGGGLEVPEEPPGSSFGLGPEAFDERLARARAAAEQGVSWVRMSAPVEVEMRSHHPPVIRVGVDVPLGRWGRDYPIQGFYSRERSAQQWLNTFGLGTGDCDRLCAGVFGRVGEEDNRLHAGLLVQGEPGQRFRYRLEWEYRPSLPAAWRAQFTVPSPKGWTLPAGDFQLRIGQDPRGLYGPVHAPVRAEVLYRLYSRPGPAHNVAGVVRSLSAWYLGVGVGASFGKPETLTPVAEAGFVVNGRLFGLIPVRSRIALVYSGGKDPWSLRWTLVE